METAYNKYFEKNISTMARALETVSLKDFEALIDDCTDTLNNGHKIIVAGLGKNVPICDKFVGTMLSVGLEAGFLHTNSAVHGDMGMVKSGDIVILLTKSGATSESIYLYELLKERNEVHLWLLSFNSNSILAEKMEKKIIVDLEHEGDIWNIMPNNSTVLNLIILQALAIELIRRLDMDLEKDFRPNHPGGAIGASFRNE